MGSLLEGHPREGGDPFPIAAVLTIMGIAACTTLGTDAMNEPLAPSGNADRGREVFLSRDGGHCVLCHSVPGVSVAGNIGPPLAGIGNRLTPGQIRLRIADITRVNPAATMPAFHRIDGERVASNYVGRPVLDAQQVEDLVAWLSTLKEAAPK